MPRKRNPYPAEFRDQIVSLHRAANQFKNLPQSLSLASRQSILGSDKMIVMAVAGRNMMCQVRH